MNFKSPVHNDIRIFEAINFSIYVNVNPPSSIHNFRQFLGNNDFLWYQLDMDFHEFRRIKTIIEVKNIYIGTRTLVFGSAYQTIKQDLSVVTVSVGVFKLPIKYRTFTPTARLMRWVSDFSGSVSHMSQP